MEPAKIVLRHFDGMILKGYSMDFNPNKSFFHLRLKELETMDDSNAIKDGPALTDKIQSKYGAVEAARKTEPAGRAK